jgi:hypothetical protein
VREKKKRERKGKGGQSKLTTNTLALFILSEFQIGHDTWFKACPIYSPI